MNCDKGQNADLQLISIKRQDCGQRTMTIFLKAALFAAQGFSLLSPPWLAFHLLQRVNVNG